MLFFILRTRFAVSLCERRASWPLDPNAPLSPWLNFVKNGKPNSFDRLRHSHLYLHAWPLSQRKYLMVSVAILYTQILPRKIDSHRRLVSLNRLNHPLLVSHLLKSWSLKRGNYQNTWPRNVVNGLVRHHQTILIILHMRIDLDLAFPLLRLLQPPVNPNTPVDHPQVIAKPSRTRICTTKPTWSLLAPLLA